MVSIIIKKIVGYTLISLGVIGLFLPILQGTLMIVAGLLLIGVEKEKMEQWFAKIKGMFKLR